MRKLLVPMLIALPLLSGGCVAKTLVDVATLPVKATGKAIDWTTTSQEESDRNYGKKMRKQEAAEGKAKRKADKQAAQDAELAEKQRRDRERNRDD